MGLLANDHAKNVQTWKIGQNVRSGKIKYRLDFGMFGGSQRDCTYHANMFP